MQIEMWPVTRFVPYSRNPRKNDHAVERMAASILEFGFKIPVLARSSGEVVDGHLRLKAAQKLGMTEVPVILCDEWTDAQVKAFRLRIDPGAKQLILDFERVHWKCDLNGNTLAEIDKSDPARSHVSDALGYLIAQEFGMRGQYGEMPGFVQ